MKIAVLAANGQAGQRIVAEAIARGHQVTAVVRSANQTQAQAVIQKDILDLSKEDLAGFDVVITAFGAFTPETLPLHTTTLLHVGQLLAGTDTRFLIVGGAGSLYLDETQTSQLKDLPDFPAEYLPLATAMGEGLAQLRQIPNLKWTYLSPAADFVADGERRGTYVRAGEVFTADANGLSQISYADFAIAMVDEAESGQHVGERISIRW